MFNAPLTLQGSSITMHGVLSKASGGLMLLAVSGGIEGTIKGSASLAAGTGDVTVEADSMILNSSTLDGIAGRITPQYVILIDPSTHEPYTVDGSQVQIDAASP